MNPDKPVRFAIVGIGYIGRRHADVIQSNHNAILVAVCDTDLSKKDLCSDYDVPFYSDIDKMLQSEDFDVLCVASPNSWHAEHALKGLRSEKHVVIEKPMAIKVSDCLEIYDTSVRMAKKVFCVMQNRYSPPSVWLKDLLTNGVLGQIYMVQINCFWNRDERYYRHAVWKGKAKPDGGTLFTQFSHFVDMMFWLFGDIQNITSKFMDFNHQKLTEFEDSGHITFDFLNGGYGSLNYSTSVWDRNLESSVTIIAEKGSVKVGGQYMNSVEYCHIENYTMPILKASNPPNDYGAYKGSASNHEYFYDNVIEALHSNAPITTNVLDGLKVVEIIERIYQTNPFFKLKSSNE